MVLFCHHDTDNDTSRPFSSVNLNRSSTFVKQAVSCINKHSKQHRVTLCLFGSH
jgi:hypothetical protein